jgi:hypothetical protein
MGVYRSFYRCIGQYKKEHDSQLGALFSSRGVITAPLGCSESRTRPQEQSK